MTVVCVKDRAITEHRILEAVDRIVATKGFERVGVNAVAQEAGVSKMLIYRYFGGRDGLLVRYILQGDFWSNVEVTFDKKESLRENLKSLFKQQILQLRENISLRRLLRWELITQNSSTDFLFERREAKGYAIIGQICKITQASREEVASLSAILSAALSYLALMSERYPKYSDLELQKATGWQTIEMGIELIIDMWLKRLENSNQKQNNKQ